MRNTSELIKKLRASGVPIPDHVENAMLKVDIEDFTKHNSEGFYHDRPVIFLETPSGGVKTISAPHMIATLLDNLELEEGQHIVVYGAKGGYISALIAHIVGENGKVTVIDPSQEVIACISNNLRGYPTVSCKQIEEDMVVDLPDLNRVLVTGQILSLPGWLSENIEDGGFAIAPIGTTSSQRLLKMERQGEDLFETDLGSVIFGPLDIADTIVNTPSPEEMAELVEQVVELMCDVGIIEQDDKSKLYDLVAELRQLPDDLPPPEELDDPSEHPMMQLIMEKGEWFVKLWPVIQSMMEPEIASYTSSDTSDDRDGHSDFIP
jgi:protein-L-isoaspartate(D-aspartate) O-methyltransferase